jgi:hypothetical protein
MQKITLVIIVLFSFVACEQNGLEPVQRDAFMKLFGDVGNTEGVDLLKLDDGYLLLGNNTNAGASTAILIKTDLLGNQLWSTTFNNISASALAKNADSYFIVGDSINNSNLQETRMSLIKTDLNGGIVESTSLGVIGSGYHGTGLTVSYTNEVVVCGYINGTLSGTDSTYLYGYDDQLAPAWSTVRKQGTTGDSRISSRTLIQHKDSTFVFTYMYGANNIIGGLKGLADNPNPLAIDLLKDNNTGDLGNFSSYQNNGGVLVQTVIINGKEAISLGFFDYNSLAVESVVLLDHVEKKRVAGTVIQASDGDIVVLGSTNEHADGSSRSDLDFYLTKVGKNGTISSLSGFEKLIGGTGNETGVAIVQADDRGFVFLGTMQNTNEVKLMVLVKVNLKGELIN